MAGSVFRSWREILNAEQIAEKLAASWSPGLHAIFLVQPPRLPHFTGSLLLPLYQGVYEKASIFIHDTCVHEHHRATNHHTRVKRKKKNGRQMKSQ